MTVIKLTQHGVTYTVEHEDSNLDFQQILELVISLLKASGYTEDTINRYING